jgi:hypothetical protein
MAALPLKPSEEAWFEDLVIASWDAGRDTAQIAADLWVSESAVHRVVVAERERRYARRQAEAVRA